MHITTAFAHSKAFPYTSRRSPHDEVAMLTSTGQTLQSMGLRHPVSDARAECLDEPVKYPFADHPLIAPDRTLLCSVVLLPSSAVLNR
jgi:hypothetical protein